MSLPAVVFAIFQTGSKSNGGVTSIAEVIARLDRVRPVILTQNETPITARWREAGVETHVGRAPGAMAGEGYHGVKRPPAWRRALNLLAFNLKAFAVVRRTGAVAVHANDPAAFWHVALGARLAGARLISNFRDTVEGRLSGRRLARWRLMHRLSDRVIVLSNDMAARWRDTLNLDDGAKFDVAYSIVDHQRFTPATASEKAKLRKALGLAAGETILLYVATFNAKKAQADFLKRAAPGLRGHRDARVVFVGDFDPAVSAYAAECLRIVDEESIAERVRFVGATDRIEDWYRAADVVLLASRYEGLARCMIEAMACGVPVASFDVSSAREMLDETGAGAVVPQGDHDALLDAALRLAGDPLAGSAGAAVAREKFVDSQAAPVYQEAYLGAGRGQ